MTRVAAAALVLGLACTQEPARATTSGAPTRTPARTLDDPDPCTELGVIVPRRSIELRAPRSGLLRSEDGQARALGEPVLAIEVRDELALVDVEAAELAVAKAQRERSLAEQRGRARELEGAEQLGEHLAAGERESARDAHAIAGRELARSDAALAAAAARLAAQRARVDAGRLTAPFAGRLVDPLVPDSAWVEAGALLGDFVSLELVVRIALPADTLASPTLRGSWAWPDQPDQRTPLELVVLGERIDELSGLRMLEAAVPTTVLGERALGSVVVVELGTCTHHETTEAWTAP